MNKNRLIFFGILVLFHFCLVIFSFYVDANSSDFKFLYKLLDWMSVLKYGALLGLVLIIADVIWSWKSHQEQKRENLLLNNELKNLKAKLFDLQEAAQKSAQQQPK